MFEQAKWMAPAQPLGDVCPVFQNTFTVTDPSEAVLTDHGPIVSNWYYTGDRVRYDIELPVAGEIVIDGETHAVGAGQYVFFSKAV